MCSPAFYFSCIQKRLRKIRSLKSDRRGSNPRSRPWQGRALPTTPLSHKRVMGIEPTYPAWKAGVLPLNYTRTVVCASLPHQRRLVYMMNLHLSTLNLNFFYFFNSMYNLVSFRQLSRISFLLFPSQTVVFHV